MKNAIALTIRSVIATVVGLYTSRIVLSALGVEDYGIYGVIGGVIGMASFLNAAMAGATSRFITFELGRGDTSKLQRIFSTALIIHIFIALAVAVFAETAGLWFVNSKMNFPPGKMFEVNVLYQFTVVSMMVGFTQVPYAATIVAHEKMNVYAYFEIANVVLKLGITFLLLAVSTNRLILYAALMLAVSVLSALIYRIYCIRHFDESKFSMIWDRRIMKEMLTFSGFDLYGNMCVSVRLQGQPIIINMFFGIVANAGASIANTVLGTICGLTRTVATAFKPSITKHYAAGKIWQMAQLMRRSTQFTLLAYSVVALPVFFCTDQIIYLWLGQVPQYSVEFFRIIVISVFIDIAINTNNTAIHATGNIKYISFVSGTFYLLSPALSYFALRFWLHDAAIVYLADIAMFAIVVVLGWYFIRRQIPDFSLGYYVAGVVKSWAAIGTAVIIVYIWIQLLRHIWIPSSISGEILNIVIISAVGAIALGSISYIYAFQNEERKVLREYIKLKIRRIIKR